MKSTVKQFILFISIVIPQLIFGLACPTPGTFTLNSPSSISTTSMTISWSSATNVVSYEVQKSTNGTTWTSSGSTTSTSRSVTGLSSGTKYYFRVIATNLCFTMVNGEVVETATSRTSSSVNAYTKPNTPVSSVASTVTSNSFRANWGTVSGTGYKLYVSTNNTFTAPVSGYNPKTISSSATGSFTVSGLSAGTNYYYRIKALASTSESAYSSTVPIETLAETPVIGTATSLDQESFIANWSTASGATDYRIDISTSPAFSNYVEQNITVSGTSYSVNNLNSATIYYYRVRSANDADVTSPNSGTSSALTLPDTPLVSAASSLTQTGFSANWSTVSGATGYELDVAIDNGFSNMLSGYPKTIADGATFIYSVTGLNPGTNYYFRIRAKNNSGSSPNSEVESLETLANVPTTDSVVSITQTSFVAQWNAATGATDYRLYVSASSDFLDHVTGYNGLVVSGTSQGITGLNEGTIYHFRVKSANDADALSDYSGDFTTITIPANPTISDPTSVLQSSFIANWAVTTGAAGYVLELATDLGFNSMVNGFPLTINSGLTNSNEITNLNPGSDYYYRIKAVNASGSSSYSAIKYAETLAEIPVVTGADNVTKSSFTANWGSSTGASGYVIFISESDQFNTHLINGDTVATNSYDMTSGLVDGGTYYYRVKAINDSDLASAYSGITTVLLKPASPHLSLTGLSQTGFTINWAVVNGAADLKLDVATDAGFNSMVGTYNNMDLTGNTQLIENLSVGETYYFRVRAINPSGETVSSSNTETLGEIPSISFSSSITQTSFSGHWGTATGATDYRLYVSTESDFSNHVIGYDGLTVNATSYNITGLNPGMTYYYRIASANDLDSLSLPSPYDMVITVPADPTVLAPKAVTQTGFSATWAKVLGASAYEIDIDNDADFSSLILDRELVNNGDTTFLMTNLQPGSNYYYRLKAKNANGKSAYSSVANVITVADNPGEMTSSLITQSSFNVSWDSVSGATSYILDVSQDNNFVTHLTGFPLELTDTSEILSGLTAGDSYYLRIKSKNSSGESNHSEILNVEVIPPDPVSTTPINAGQTSFSAKWSTSNGATGYKIDIASDNDFNNIEISDLLVNDGNASSTVVSGLPSGIVHYYRVRAINSGGQSGYSATQNILLIPINPGEHSGGNVGLESYTLHWDSVSGATTYFLEVSEDPNFNDFISGFNPKVVTDTFQLVSYLNAGTAYYSRLRSYNAAGTSGNSTVLNVITETAAPIIGAASGATQTSFVANWSSSSGATGYKIDVSEDNFFGSYTFQNIVVSGGGTTSKVVTGLVPGKTYFHRIKATSSGESDYSETESILLIPANPTGIETSQFSSTSFTISWDTVIGVSSYLLDVSLNNTFDEFIAGFHNRLVSDTSAVITSLNPGINYYIRLRAQNSSGTSNYSDIHQTVTIPPVTVIASATNISQTYFSANWNTVSGATGYLVDVATDQLFSNLIVSEENINDGNTSFQVTSLSEGNTYYYRVKAYNGSGVSDYSSYQSVVTVPSNPGILTINEITNSGFKIGWDSVNGADQYFLDISVQADFQNFLDGYQSFQLNDTFKVVANLSAGTTFHARLRAGNGSGVSGYSSEFNVVLIPEVPQVLIAASVEEDGFTASWSTSTGANTYAIDVAGDASFSDIITGYNDVTTTDTFKVVTALTAGENYYFRVRAFNENGSSAESTGLSVLILAAPTINLTGSGQHSLSISWNSVVGASSYIVSVSENQDFNNYVTGYDQLEIANQSVTVNQLDAGKHYYIRIKAKNLAGTSGFSEVLHVITNPENTIVQEATMITNNSFATSWSKSTGATSYNLEVSLDENFNTNIKNFQVSIQDTFKIVDELSPGTIHYYRLYAINASGASGYSDTIKVETLPDIPDNIEVINIEQTTFETRWQPTAGATDYRLYVSTDQGFSSHIVDGKAISGNSHKVDNLVAGSTYYFNVKAANAGGLLSQASVVSQVLMKPANIVTLPASQVETSEFIANWQTSAQVDSYELSVSTDESLTSIITGYPVVLSADKANHKVTGLNPGTKYYYNVRVKNASGLSERSATVNIETLAQVSGSLKASSITQSSFVANWIRAEGAANYRLDVSATSDFSTFIHENLVVSDTSALIENLESGNTYYFRVSGENSNGTNSEESTTQVVKLISGTPSLFGSTEINQTTFKANWMFETGTDSYMIDLSNHSGFDPANMLLQNVSVTDTFHTFTDLQAGNIYYYRVRAGNASGTSGYSGFEAIQMLPEDPLKISFNNISQTSISVTWSASNGANSYVIEASEKEDFSLLLDGYPKGFDLPNLIINGLTAATEYFVRIKSINSSGASGYSLTGVQTTLPEVPVMSFIEAKSTSLKADWNSVSGAIEYELLLSENDNASFTNLVEGYDPMVITGISELTIQDLKPNTRYFAKIKAIGQGGSSAFSESAEGFTTNVGDGGQSVISNLVFDQENSQINFTASSRFATSFEQIRFLHKLSEENNFSEEDITPITVGTEYTIEIPDDWVDVLGFQAKVVAQDIDGQVISTNVHNFSMLYNQIETPVESFGKTARDYTIISVPFDLEEKKIEDVFVKQLGNYDKNKWRLMRYENGQSRDYLDGLSKENLTRGKSYWFLSKDEIKLDFGVGVSPDNSVDNLFKIVLSQGWNQIANPYPFDINWSDVLAYNFGSSNVDHGLVGYVIYQNGSFIESDIMKPFKGGFVYAKEGTTIEIPLKVLNSISGGRIADQGRDFGTQHWELPITVTQGDVVNSLPAVGMNPKAKMGLDGFDMVNLPTFFEYSNLISREENLPITRSIVRTEEEYVWTFGIEQSVGTTDIKLSWDSRSSGIPDDAYLYLYDGFSQKVVNMLEVNSYVINAKTSSFKIYYSKDYPDFLTDMANIAIGTPYPNPSTGPMNFPFHLALESSELVKATLIIYDQLGRQLFMTDQVSEGKGLIEIFWDGMSDYGQPLNPGIYFYKMNILNNGKIDTKNGKLLIR